VLAALDLEEELAEEGLMVFLAQELVPLRKIVALLHLETLEGLDELHRVFLAAEARLLHADAERVHRLVVRLHVPVGQGTGGIDLLEALGGFLEEPLLMGWG